MRIRLLAIVITGCALVGCSIGDTNDGSAVDDGSAATADAFSATDSTTTPTPPTTSTTVPAIDDLVEVRWVLIDNFDGLIDDQSRPLVAPEQGFATLSSVARGIDGSVYFINKGDDVVWRWPVDSNQPIELDLGTDAVPTTDGSRLGYNEQSQVIVNRHGERLLVDTDEPGLRQRSFSDRVDERQIGGASITAANGVTVEVLPTTGTFSPEGGYLERVDEPAEFRVLDPNGEVVWTVILGGVGAPWLDLVDFDGRYVMLSRAPGEPADPVLQHIVYDLDCHPGATPAECTDTFGARFGSAALVGPDHLPGDDGLNPQLPILCPTMNQEIATPAELTDPSSFEEGFDDEQRQAFEDAALSLSLCDPWGLRPFAGDGLGYDSEKGQDAWLWTEFAAALRGPVHVENDGSRVWSTHPDRASVVMSREFSYTSIAFHPPRSRLPGNIAVVVTEDDLVLRGQSDGATVEQLRAAASVVADKRSLEITDLLDVGGPSLQPEVVSEFVDSLTAGLADSVAVGEVHLTEDGVVTSMTDSTDPETVEQNLGFAIADFASGGEGVFNDLPLADSVALALGSEVRALRTPLELSQRQGWVINAAEFAGYGGPFNVLDRVPAPSMVTVGPHPRCGSPTASAAPSSLAAFRRISVLPAEGSLESCLEWAAVDVYLDSRGVIQGIGLDLVGP